MASDKKKRPRKDTPKTRRAGKAGGKRAVASPVQPALPYDPTVRPGDVEFPGVVPEGIRIDPDLTEGHPGYEESGDSEVIPAERLAGGKKRPGK